MSIQWVLVATFLYSEMGLIVLLTLPFISSRVWSSLLGFSFWKPLKQRASMYFTVILIILVLFLLDSIRDMIKYTGNRSHDLEADMQTQVKLFRSQRNYYIAGFSIFLSFVVRRLALLHVQEADLINRNENAMKKAHESTKNAEKQIKDLNQQEKHCTLVPNEHNQQQIKELTNKLNHKNLEIIAVKEEVERLMSRCESVSQEYSVLLEKHAVLKGQVN